jgi:hypothetical protein
VMVVPVGAVLVHWKSLSVLGGAYLKEAGAGMTDSYHRNSTAVVDIHVMDQDADDDV